MPEQWDAEEPVLPVVGCVGSAGASTTALAVATAAGHARVLECSTVTTSGLASAATAELGSTPAGWALGRREGVLVARTTEAFASPADLPLPDLADPPVSLTVLDVGWELNHALTSRGWLTRALEAAPHVVAVSTATIPGMRRLEAALAMLGPARVVVAVVGPPLRRWPRGVEPSMGSLARAAADRGDLVQIPTDRGLAGRGVDSTPLPAPLLAAAATILRQVGAGPIEKGTP